MFKTMPQFLVLAIWVMFFTTPVSAQDMSQYYTVQNPDDFTIDWTGFYHRMNANTRPGSGSNFHIIWTWPTALIRNSVLDLYLPEGEVSKRSDIPVPAWRRLPRGGQGPLRFDRRAFCQGWGDYGRCQLSPDRQRRALSGSAR